MEAWVEALPFDLGARDVLVVVGEETAAYTLEEMKKHPNFASPDGIVRFRQVKALLCVDCLPSEAGLFSLTVRALVSRPLAQDAAVAAWETAERGRCTRVPLDGFFNADEPVITEHVLELCGVGKRAPEPVVVPRVVIIPELSSGDDAPFRVSSFAKSLEKQLEEKKIPVVFLDAATEEVSE